MHFYIETDHLIIKGLKVDHKKCGKIDEEDQHQLLTQKLVPLLLIRLTHSIKTMKRINDHQRQDDIFG